MVYRQMLVAAGLTAGFLAMSGCAPGGGREIRVAGEYEKLAACLHAELARDEPGVLIGYAVDQPGKRARIWRDDDNRTFQSAGGGGFAAYSIYLAQTGEHDVTIHEQDRSLNFGATDFMNRFLPMVRRCIAETSGASAN